MVMGVAVTMAMSMAGLVVFVRTFFVGIFLVRTEHQASIAKGYMLRNLSYAGVGKHLRATGCV